jgi:hypothetical protein
MLLALLLAAGAAAEPPLSVFSDPRLAGALGRFDPHPGAWAEYAVLPKSGPQTRLKISVLAPPLPDGRYWLEMASQSQGLPPVATRLLLHGPPPAMDNVDRLQVYVGGTAPMEVPLEEVRAAMKKRENPPGPAPKVQQKGAEEQTVAAGTFRCDVLQVRDARICRTDKVPLWGLVTERDPKQRIELIGYSDSGAETVFPPGFDQKNGSESTK